MGLGPSRPESATPNDFPAHHPPFFSECEVLYEGGPSSTQLFDGCKKNPDHPTFIPVKEFTMEHLPAGYQTENVMKTIKHYSDKTVKVIVKYTSLDRPATFPNSKSPYPFTEFKGSSHKTRVGTGFIVAVLGDIIRDQHCRCGKCKTSNEPVNEYREFIVRTAAHVIFDDSEAERSTFELFYDSEEDRENVECLYGVRLFADNDSEIVTMKSEKDLEESLLRRCHIDTVRVLCVSHNLDLDFNAKSLLSNSAFGRTSDSETRNDTSDGIYEQNVENETSFGIIISHPHGSSKRITTGSILHFNIPLPLHILDRQERDNTPFRWFQNGKAYLHLQKPKTVIHKAINGTQLRVLSVDTSVLSPAVDAPLTTFLKHCQPLNNSTEFYTLKTDLILSIPYSSPFRCQRKFDSLLWMAFPFGTRYRPIDESHSFILPSGVTFDMSFWHQHFFKTYNIDTCAGSSGAPLLREFKRSGPSHTTTHSGTLIGGLNKSALQ